MRALASLLFFVSVVCLLIAAVMAWQSYQDQDAAQVLRFLLGGVVCIIVAYACHSFDAVAS